MPQLQSWLGSYIPSPLNETVAVSHLKICAFDEDVIISGANLSRDYFTDRQDRYVYIPSANNLATFYHTLIDILSEGSYHYNVQSDHMDTGQVSSDELGRQLRDLLQSVPDVSSSNGNHYSIYIVT